MPNFSIRHVKLFSGVGQFDKIAIIANNRWEWATLAAAAYSMNASLVPMYEAQLPSDWTYILNDSGSCAVFCATQEIFDQVQKEVLPSTPTVKVSLCLDAPEGEPHSFKTAMAASAGDAEGSLILAPTPEDLANLIYTSGTTGKPKGVELTHLNFTTNVKAAARSLTDNPQELIRESDRSLAFLPWAHSYGQTCELWMSMSMGSGIGICRGVPMLLEDLQMVKPSVLFAVPTLYKKIYDGVHNLMESSSPLRKNLMKSGLALGKENVAANNGLRGPLGPIESIKYNVLNKVVLSKIRDRFGGNLRHGFVAGAACPTEVLNFMDAIGIPICEGYGLTETSPIICLNVPTQRMVGSVGRPIGGVTVHIIGEDGKPLPPGEEGEICCTGPNVMKGYHNNQKATDEVISVAPDGKSRM
jgi:long-chain acyl-CoA synthetase